MKQYITDKIMSLHTGLPYTHFNKNLLNKNKKKLSLFKNGKMDTQVSGWFCKLPAVSIRLSVQFQHKIAFNM